MRVVKEKKKKTKLFLLTMKSVFANFDNQIKDISTKGSLFKPERIQVHRSSRHQCFKTLYKDRNISMNHGRHRMWKICLRSRCHSISLWMQNFKILFAIVIYSRTEFWNEVFFYFFNFELFILYYFLDTNPYLFEMLVLTGK